MCAFVCVGCVFASSRPQLALVFVMHVFVVVYPLVCLHYCGCVIVCACACFCVCARVSAGLEPVGVVLVQSWTWGRGHRRQLVWRARLATTSSSTAPSAQSREHTHGVVSATNMEHEAHDAWNSGSSATSSSVTNKLSELGRAPLLSAETETNSTFGDRLHFTRHPNPLWSMKRAPTLLKRATTGYNLKQVFAGEKMFNSLS